MSSESGNDTSASTCFELAGFDEHLGRLPVIDATSGSTTRTRGRPTTPRADRGRSACGSPRRTERTVPAVIVDRGGPVRTRDRGAAPRRRRSSRARRPRRAGRPSSTTDAGCGRTRACGRRGRRTRRGARRPSSVTRRRERHHAGATALAEPPLDPPGVRVGSHGLRVTRSPGSRCRPTCRTRARRSCRRAPHPRRGTVRRGSRPRRRGAALEPEQPWPVGMPSQSSRSFTPNGTPASGPGSSPRATGSSIRSAWRGRSASMWTNELSSGLWRSIAATSRRVPPWPSSRLGARGQRSR